MMSQVLSYLFRKIKDRSTEHLASACPRFLCHDVDPTQLTNTRYPQQKTTYEHALSPTKIARLQLVTRSKPGILIRGTPRVAPPRDSHRRRMPFNSYSPGKLMNSRCLTPSLYRILSAQNRCLLLKCDALQSQGSIGSKARTGTGVEGWIALLMCRLAEINPGRHDRKAGVEVIVSEVLVEPDDVVCEVLATRGHKSAKTAKLDSIRTGNKQI